MPTTERQAVDGHYYVYDVEPSGRLVQWSSVHSWLCPCLKEDAE
jgi:hypothetical protein